MHQIDAESAHLVVQTHEVRAVLREVEPWALAKDRVSIDDARLPPIAQSQRFQRRHTCRGHDSNVALEAHLCLHSIQFLIWNAPITTFVMKMGQLLISTA